MDIPVDNKRVRTLFAGQGIAEFLTSKMNDYAEDLARWNPGGLLATSPDKVAAELLKRHGVMGLRIHEPDGTPDSVDRTVNLGREYSFHDVRRSVKVYRLAVPFTGDAGLFSIRPTTYTLNPPAGHVDSSGRRLTVEFVNPAGEAPDPEKIGKSFAEVLRSVNWHLDQHRDAVEGHNTRIADLGPIQQRIAAIKAERDILSKIPLPKVSGSEG
ncbi:hypothetical protein GCM10023346_43530 [Arthrobacter gyeryongensis]|uniref:Uncharacterized protein n=1 Tax=Arthrobacter gyeryongensis TaxID=1650592 RepID=A0ABP9SQC7_9MICC